MKIPDQYKSLQFEHAIAWPEIFAVWRAYEAYQKSWKEHWKERGFSSWEAWRKSYVAPMKPETLKWSVYRIANPKTDVPQMFGVPSRGWQKKCYGGEATKMIGDILNHPTISDNSKIKEIENNFPYQTMLTGVIHDGKIILVEGMHRACAISRMEKIPGDVVIALAEIEGELPSLGKGDSF